jgi:N-acetylglucosamine-6-phosphate deacetylase
MATAVPARIIGESKRGMLRVGNFADLILVDDQFNLKLVVIGGKEAHRSNDAP